MTTTATTGRAGWHRWVAPLPLAYLAGVAAVGLAHPLLPSWRWLAIHLLLLGAVTNAIVVWSAHFTVAILHRPTARGTEAIRLATLNLGIAAVLVGGGTGRPWLGVLGAAVVFAAIGAHLAWLARQLRAALPARFAVTVRYYLAAAVALLTGVPVGAWMLVVDDDHRARLLLFHAHVNLLGWVTLTVVGTLLTLWPTILRTRVAESATGHARTALPIAGVGLAALATGVLAWWPVLAVAGIATFTSGVLLNARAAVREARTAPPASFAGWSIAAAVGWLVVALGWDAWSLATAANPAVAAAAFDGVLVPLLVGFTAQVLLGALAYLLPVVLGGGPAEVRLRTARLDRHWAQRVVMANVALAVFLLPVGSYVRITTSLLVFAALIQFLVPAIRILLASRR